ncbi:hypothetical protein GCM10027519_02000 [Kineococcus endophyticus]
MKRLAPDRSVGATTRNRTNRATAPMSDPISGRDRMTDTNGRVLTRSSADVALPPAWVVAAEAAGPAPASPPAFVRISIDPSSREVAVPNPAV